jgi:hypothetical protein
MPRRAATQPKPTRPTRAGSSARSQRRAVAPAKIRRASPAVLDLIHTCRQQSAIAGKCWDKSEAALEALVSKVGTGRVLGIEDGVFFKLQDLFEEKATVIVPKAMRRYRLVICDANGKEIRLRDRIGRKKRKAA